MGLDENITPHTISLDAAEDLSASQFCGVVLGASGVELAGIGDAIDGVLYNADADAAGKPCTVVRGGRVKVKYGGTVTKGDPLKLDASGRFVTATAGDVIVGKAAESGAVNNIGSMTFGYLGTADASGAEVISATGATLSASARHHFLEISGTMAGTLPDGIYDGQEKVIHAVAAADTPAYTLAGKYDTNGTGTTAALFNAAADQLRLVWSVTEDAWRVITNVSVSLS